MARMRTAKQLCRLLVATCAWSGALALQHHNDITSSAPPQHVLHPSSADDDGGGISEALFSELERLARLVDITYCVGTTGISRPFTCASRCSEFPGVQLVTTWNTGALLTDSCGYVAVDHSAQAGGEPASSAPGRYGGAPGAIIVAFRGTYSITNTVIDLSTVPQEYVPYPDDPEGDGAGAARERCDNCTVHMGFLASWRMARGLVLPALREARRAHPNYPIHLVGHSLGGAVAALAALELRLVEGWGGDDGDLVVTTFGEPRVGNRGLARFIDKVFDMDAQDDDDDAAASVAEPLRYRRVTHAGDPVPLLPLSEWGYRAHAGEVFIGKPALPPYPEDLRLCRGAHDPACSDPAAGEESSSSAGLLSRLLGASDGLEAARLLPTRLKLWELFFAHRDYFWRLGLCVPGGDPADWGRDKYRFDPTARPDEL